MGARSILVLAFLLLTPISALGQQAVVEAPSSLEERVKKLEEALKAPPLSFLREIEASGYVETTYNFNLNDPPSQDNEFRIFDDKANQLMINNTELSILKEPTDEAPVGFGIVLNVGRDAKSTHAAGLGTSDDILDLQQAYAAFKVPIGNGLDLKFGKFATLLGAEVIEGPANVNVSRSFLFGFAIPFTHVGALAGYSPMDQLGFTVGIVQGWDNADDNNRDKSFLGQISLTPVAALTVAVNGIWGPEQDLKNGANRWVVDVVATLNPLQGIPFLERLTLQLNADYGGEDDAVDRGGVPRKAVWWGIAGIANYDITEKLSFAIRGEYFIDEDGARTGFEGTGATGLPLRSRLRLWEVTTTAKYKIWKGLFGRLEYRHDNSTGQRVFDGEGGERTRKTQDTLAVEAVYQF